MDTTAVAPQAGVASRLPHRWRALGLLSAAQFMLILDVTVVTVALPDATAALGLDRVAATWVMSAYTLAFGGLMLLGGRAADLFGARRVAMTGLAIFTTASLVCGLAGGAEMLVAGRAAQGVGAALLSPSALSIVTTIFHGTERVRALSVWSGLGGLGAAVGVLVGGALTAGPGWPWVFYINLPVGLVVLATLPSTVPAQRPLPGRRRIDLPGALTVTAATGALVYALVGAGDRGWVNAATLVPLGAAVVLYLGFVLLQRMVASPLVDLSILTRRSVVAGALLMITATGVLVANLFLGSFYLQRLHGLDALTTGLLYLPVAVGTVVGAHTSGHVLARFGPRRVVPVGLALTAVGSVTPAIMPGVAALIVGLSVAALGLGATFVTAFTTAIAHVDHRQAGLASGIVNTFHELGGAIGVALASTLAASSLEAARPVTEGFGNAFVGTSVAAVAAAVLVPWLLPGGRPTGVVRPHAH